MLLLTSVNAVGQNAPEVGDFKSKLSGNWNDYTIWQVYDGVEFIDAVAGQIPSRTNSVYLEEGLTVTLTQNESVNNFHFNSKEDVLRFNTQENILDVWGKLRGYTGVAPGTGGVSGASDITNPFLLFNTGTNGRIRIRGSFDRNITVPSDFTASRRLAGWTLEIALDQNVIGSFLNSIRIGQLIVTSGIMEVPADGSHYIRVDMTGADVGINGKVLIKSGATLIPGAGLSRSNAVDNYFEELTLEEGGFLFYKQKIGTGAAAALLTQTINMNGTFGLIRAANQVFPSTSLNSTTNAAKLTHFHNLLLNGSGDKTLTNNITIQSTLELKGTANINLNTAPYILSYGAEGSLKYSGSEAQTTSQKEYPNVNGPKNLIINNPFHVTLHENKDLEGDLSIENGRFILGNRIFSLGVNSGPVNGSFSADNMVLINGTGRMRKYFNSPQTFSFPIGESTGTTEYSPVNVTLNEGTLNASTYIEARVNGEKHPDNTSTSEFLSRYWTVTSNISDINFNAVFHYLEADINGEENSVISYHFAGPDKTALNTIDANANQMEVFNISALGNFTGANLCGVYENVVTAPSVTTFCGSGDVGAILGNLPETGGSRDFSWERKFNDEEWVPISGQSTENLDEGLLSVAGKYEYRRILHTNLCLSTPVNYSNIITINIYPVLENNIISDPQFTEFCESATGYTISGTTPNGGDGVFAYEWQRRFDGGAWTAFETTLDYTENEVLTNTGSYEYRRVITSGSCESISNIVAIDLYDKLSIIADIFPATDSKSDGSIALTISGGKPSYTFVWTNQSSTSALLGGLTAGTYSVTVTDVIGCQITKEFVVPQVTGIGLEKTSSANVIYPNPFSNEINILFNNQKPSKVLITLMDNQGKIIFTKDISHNNEEKVLINIEDIPLGLYYLNVISDGKSQITKVQKGL